jgi:hypothetical protein
VTARRTATRSLALALLAPAAVLALSGTALAETPAQQPAPFQLVLPAEPVGPKGPTDLVLAPHVDPKGPELAPAPAEPPAPKPAVPGPADLTDDVTDPGPHPAPHPGPQADLPIGPAPVDEADLDDLTNPEPSEPGVPDDKAGPNPADEPETLDVPEDGTGDGVEPTDGSSFGDAAADSDPDSGSLPFTGGSTVLLLSLGLSLTAAGIAAQRIAKAQR